MFRVMVHTSKMGPACFLVEQGPFCERTATLIDFFSLPIVNISYITIP